MAGQWASDIKKTVSIALTTANGINYPVSHRRMGNLLDTRANMYNIYVQYICTIYMYNIYV